MYRIYANGELIYEPGDQLLFAIDLKLTLEMGKAGSLEATLPPEHPYLTQLKQLSTPIIVTDDDLTIFRGRVLSRTRSFTNQYDIYCEGDLSYLVDSVQKAEKYEGKTHELFRKIIQNHNARMPAEKQFTPGNITAENRDIKLTGQSEEVNVGQIDYKQIAINSIVDNWNTTYDYIENCLISYCGGYLMTRKVGDVTYLDWIEDYTDTATQEIEFGENMLDLTDELSSEDIFTVLIPLGDENLTIKSVNGGSDELIDTEAVSNYGRIVKTQVFSNVNEASTLLENGRRYLANEGGSAPRTFTITAVDLHLVHPEIESIHLGDRVYIRSKVHNISQYLTCTKIEYDLLNPANTVYTFGREKQTLTQRYREDQRKQSDTYGSSIGSGKGIGAAAVHDWHLAEELSAEASEETDEKIKKELDEFYDAWIKCDPDMGTVNLGALYQRLKHDEAILENKVGINMDAEMGSINIFADHTRVLESADEINKVKQVLHQNAGINIDGVNGKVDIFATANLASQADSNANAAATKAAHIYAWAGYDEATGKLGTNIALESDMIYVKGRLSAYDAVFSNVSGDTVYVSKGLYVSGGGIGAVDIYGSNVYVATGRDSSYNLANLVGHAHNIQKIGGKLYISGPVPFSERTGFNWTDGGGSETPSVESIEFATYSDDGSTDYEHIIINYSNGDSVYATLPENAWNTGYNRGWQRARTKYEPKDIRITSTINPSTNGTHYLIEAIAYNQDSEYLNSYTATHYDQYFNTGTQAYVNGTNAGGGGTSPSAITNISYCSYDGEPDYSHVNVYFADGSIQDWVTIPDAHTIGWNAVDVDSVNATGWNEQAGYDHSAIWITANLGAHRHGTTMYAGGTMNVRLQNGKSTDRNVFVFADSLYQAGITEGKQQTQGSISVRVEKRYETYGQHRKYWVGVANVGGVSYYSSPYYDN